MSSLYSHSLPTFSPLSPHSLFPLSGQSTCSSKNPESESLATNEHFSLRHLKNLKQKSGDPKQ